MSQEFSGTEDGIIGALSRVHDFLMIPLVQGHSGTAPEMSANAYGTNQGTNEDNSRSDAHPEASVFEGHRTRKVGPEDSHDMVTGAHEGVTYCSASTSNGKQKKQLYQSRAVPQ